MKPQHALFFSLPAFRRPHHTRRFLDISCIIKKLRLIIMPILYTFTLLFWIQQILTFSHAVVKLLLVSTKLCTYVGLTHAVSPEVPPTAAVSSSQDIDITIGAAAGVLVAVRWGLAALGEQSPQARTTLTHSWHRPLSEDYFLKEATWKCLKSYQMLYEIIALSKFKWSSPIFLFPSCSGKISPLYFRADV